MAYSNDIISWVKKIKKHDNDINNLRTFLIDEFDAKNYDVYFTSGKSENYKIMAEMCYNSFKLHLNMLMNVILINPESKKIIRYFENMELQKNISTTTIHPDNDFGVNLNLIDTYLQDNTGLVILPYSSSFSGIIYPVQKISNLLNKNNKSIPLCVDFSNLFGKTSISLIKKNITALIFDFDDLINNFGFGVIIIQKKMLIAYRVQPVFFDKFSTKNNDVVSIAIAKMIIDDLILNQKKYNAHVKKIKELFIDNKYISYDVPDKNDIFIAGDKIIVYGKKNVTSPYKIALFTYKNINKDNFDIKIDKYRGNIEDININPKVLKKSISISITPLTKKKEIERLIENIVPL
jgi:hypothetical protein